MFSMPPATMISASPARMICDASVTDFRPEPHSMLMVVAGTSTGSPAPIAAWRAAFWPRPACSTHPSRTSSTSSGETSARSSAALIAWLPSSVAGTSLK